MSRYNGRKKLRKRRRPDLTLLYLAAAFIGIVVLTTAFHDDSMSGNKHTDGAWRGGQVITYPVSRYDNQGNGYNLSARAATFSSYDAQLSLHIQFYNAYGELVLDGGEEHLYGRYLEQIKTCSDASLYVVNTWSVDSYTGVARKKVSP
ncbi:MAG: hypothetical protein ACOX88_09790 [Christensenellales bacterium]